MQIQDIKVLQGPNYWSVRRPQLIAMVLDLEELENYPTDKIPGFFQRLKQTMPSLYNHRCSEGVPGGFFDRVQRGTWMGHVIEHIALELQTLAGMETGFGRTRGTGKRGVYNVVFSYVEPQAGKYAAYAAVRIAEALVKGTPYVIDDDIKTLEEIAEEYALGPSTKSIVEEALKRGIPFMRLDGQSLVQLGWGKYQQRIQATITDTTSNIAVEIACNKQLTKKLLEKAEVPVPSGGIVQDEDELRDVLKNIGYPAVLKPVDGNQGKGATTNILNWPEALTAFAIARRYSGLVICEKHVVGEDFRALVINNNFIAAAKRTPGQVTGDGVQTIQQLVDVINSDPRRGCDHGKVLTQIKIDEITLQILRKKGYTLDTVLQKNETLCLKPTANLSTGGTAEDVTDQVHEWNKRLFERIARVIGLNICGIDIIATDLSKPINEINGAVLEVNAAPGFRMHLAPTHGQPRNVAKPVVDMLFPNDTRSRIPIIAITGTNGKTTTTRLTAHMAKHAGFTVGYTTTDGIYLNDELIVKGDCAGPKSAAFILQDATVDFAVLETARGGILRSGLAFDACDVAIITNIAEDHLGLQGIDTIEKLASVKAVVAEAVSKNGFAVLNADDDLVYSIREKLSCNVGLFSLHTNSERIKNHCENGGVAAVFENGYITIIDKHFTIRVEDVINIPITFKGSAQFNVANALAATLAAYVQDISLDAIRQALKTFIPSPEQTPGRLNMFDFNEFKVIVDYAHNAHGIKALGQFIRSLNATTTTGVIAGIGDRRDEDIIAVACESAKIFGNIIVRQDKDLRGRTEKEINYLLLQGLEKGGNNKVTFYSNEPDAVTAAISNAVEGSLVVIMSDDVGHTISMVKQLQQDMEALDMMPA